MPNSVQPVVGLTREKGHGRLERLLCAQHIVLAWCSRAVEPFCRTCNCCCSGGSAVVLQKWLWPAVSGCRGLSNAQWGSRVCKMVKRSGFHFARTATARSNTCCRHGTQRTTMIIFELRGRSFFFSFLFVRSDGSGAQFSVQIVSVRFPRRSTAKLLSCWPAAQETPSPPGCWSRPRRM